MFHTSMIFITLSSQMRKKRKGKRKRKRKRKKQTSYRMDGTKDSGFRTMFLTQYLLLVTATQSNMISSGFRCSARSS